MKASIGNIIIGASLLARVHAVEFSCIPGNTFCVYPHPFETSQHHGGKLYNQMDATEKAAAKLAIPAVQKYLKKQHPNSPVPNVTDDDLPHYTFLCTGQHSLQAIGQCGNGPKSFCQQRFLMDVVAGHLKKVPVVCENTPLPQLHVSGGEADEKSIQNVVQRYKKENVHYLPDRVDVKGIRDRREKRRFEKHWGRAVRRS